MAAEAAEAIRAITAESDGGGRPTGSDACRRVLEYVRETVRALSGVALTVIDLDDGAGLVVRLVPLGASDGQVVLLYTHVDFHPQMHKTDGDAHLFDNSGGVAMLLEIVVDLARMYGGGSAPPARPVHVAFLTGGDVYASRESQADRRRVHGFGVAAYVRWAQGGSHAHSCAVNVYASLYEVAQTCLELEEAGRNDRFLYLHVLGAGYALGVLNVTRDSARRKVFLQLPPEAEAQFDTAVLRAYNEVASESIVNTRDGGGVYLVPGCHPPRSDSSTQQLSAMTRVPVLQVDAPLCLSPSDSGSVAPSAFAHVKAIVLATATEFVRVRSSRYFLGGTRQITVQCGGYDEGGESDVSDGGKVCLDECTRGVGAEEQPRAPQLGGGKNCALQ